MTFNHAFSAWSTTETDDQNVACLEKPSATSNDWNEYIARSPWCYHIKSQSDWWKKLSTFLEGIRSKPGEASHCKFVIFTFMRTVIPVLANECSNTSVFTRMNLSHLIYSLIPRSLLATPKPSEVFQSLYPTLQGFHKKATVLWGFGQCLSWPEWKTCEIE